MDTVSISQVRSHLNSIVERFGPDHKATNPNATTPGAGSCIYGVVSDGVLTPVCIVGQFFASIGALHALMDSPAHLINGYSSSEPEQAATCEPSAQMWERVERRTDISFPTKVRQYLRDAQLAQDSGRTWVKSLLFADDMLMWRASTDAAERAGIYQMPDQPNATDERYADPVSVQECMDVIEPLADWERELLGEAQETVPF